MLCGDYYTYEMKAKYQGGSPFCRLCEPKESNIENIEHILTICSNYEDVRIRVLSEIKNILEDIEYIHTYEPIFLDTLKLTQFILDCTSFNLPIRLHFNDKKALEIFELSRGLCYSINKRRLQMLNELTRK